MTFPPKKPPAPLLQAIVFGSLRIGVPSYTESLIIKKSSGFGVELYAILLNLSSFLSVSYSLANGVCLESGAVTNRTYLGDFHVVPYVFQNRTCSPSHPCSFM